MRTKELIVVKTERESGRKTEENKSEKKAAKKRKKTVQTERGGKKTKRGLRNCRVPKGQSNIELDALKMSSKPGDPKSWFAFGKYTLLKTLHKR